MSARGTDILKKTVHVKKEWEFPGMENWDESRIQIKILSVQSHEILMWEKEKVRIET